MLTIEQIQALSTGDTVYYSYIPHKRKRPVTLSYVFCAHGTGSDTGYLIFGTGLIKTRYRTTDSGLSLTK